MRIFCLLLASGFFIVSGVCAEGGRFLGRLEMEVLDDPQHEHQLRLIRALEFQDSVGRRWSVPAGGILDDQTVPRPLRVLPGLPAAEAYRRAAAVHGYFSLQRMLPWRDVHRLLPDAALAEGLSQAEAKLLYLTVYTGSWHWEPEGSHCYGVCHSAAPQIAWRPDPTAADLLPLVAYVREGNPSLADLEQRMDALLERFGPHGLGLPR